MFDKKEIAHGIEAFMEKYSDDVNKVTWPENNSFKVERASSIKVKEDSIKDLKNGFWEFEAFTTVHILEKNGTNIPLNAQRKISGNAEIGSIVNVANQTLPNVKNVSILEFKF